MSSILKALKKLEDEKTARRNGGTDVARGILRSNTGQNRKTRWVLPVSVAGSALVAAFLTYFLTGGHTLPGREAVPVSSGKGSPVTFEKKAPVQGSEPEIKKSVPDEPAVAMPADSASKKKIFGPISLPVYRKPPLPLSDNKRNAKASSEERWPGPNNRMLQRNVAESERPPEVHSPPTLRVSGIAWNRDSSERLAVVNGMSVTEGTVIEGVRVEEIMKDKVRFSFEKKTFEVALGNEMR